MSNTELASWRDTATRQAIKDFVDTLGDLPPEERVAVFDNDGTLWCEKPMPIQLDFILRRLAETAATDQELRDRQPWKAAYERDFAWLGAAMSKHYQGDNGDLKLLIGAVQRDFGGMAVDDYETAVTDFLRDAEHPTLGRLYRRCAYQPMLELLRYLEASGCSVFIASGGDRDFMRPTSMELYGIPRDRVIGSSFALEYKEDEHGGSVLYKGELDFFDDGPQKPVRIWSRVGRRPLVAAGNSNGDVQMLQFASGQELPALRLLVLHDDAEREFDYTAGAEEALARARDQGWMVISIKDDWDTVFGDPT